MGTRQLVLLSCLTGIALGGFIGYGIGSDKPIIIKAPTPLPPMMELPSQGKLQNEARDAQARGLVEQALRAAQRYYQLKGTYAGFTSQELHKLEPNLASTSPLGNQKPGPQADPRQISLTLDGVRLLPEEGKVYNILLCSISKASSTYCISDDRKRRRTLYAKETFKTLAEAARGSYRISW